MSGGHKGRPAYLFRWTGRDWEVVFGGGKTLHLPNLLGARYLNHLLHAPNEPISAFDLEVAITPEKGTVRARNSIQPESNPRALREDRQELRRIEAERAKTQAAGDRQEVEGLEDQIAALERALKGEGGAADTGERARNNVRHAVCAVMARLESGGPESKEFAEHLRSHLRVGFECLYSQPEGRIW